MELSSSIATRLQYQHKSLLEILEGISEEQVHIKPAPEKWSIFEIIVHLQTYQHVVHKRVSQIRQEDFVPAFEAYIADTDPAFLENCKKTFREIMQDLITTRKDMAAEFMKLTQAELDKKGIHPVYGSMSLQLWLNFFLLHEAHHLFIIFKQAGKIRVGIKKTSNRI